MTTSTWTAASGAWNDSLDWSAGIPQAGGVAVINDAQITLDTGMFTDGTLDGVHFELNPVAGLTLDLVDASLGPATSIDLAGPVTIDSIGVAAIGGSGHLGTDATGGILVVNLIASTLDGPGFINNASLVLTTPSGGLSEIDLNPVGDNATFTNAGAIAITAGGAMNDDLGNTAGAQVRNSGTIAFLGNGHANVDTQGRFDDPMQNSGTIVVNGGGTLNPALTFVNLLAPVSGAGEIAVRNGTVFLESSDSGGTVQFFGDLGVFEIFDPTAAFGATLENFGLTDGIRYYQPVSGVSYAGSAAAGTLTVSFSNGGSQELALANPAGVTFTHTRFTASDDVVSIACFRAGTRILTMQGEVAVEALRVGDRVPTLDGRVAPVRWIGQRRVGAARPVRIAGGAFGVGAPHRELWLSPDHAVRVGGVLIPVRYLVNGVTVAALDVAEVTYVHVELDRHAVLLAEGMAAESFLDTGNRAGFADEGVRRLPRLTPALSALGATAFAHLCLPDASSSDPLSP